jgi:hypothetical protein
MTFLLFVATFQPAPAPAPGFERENSRIVNACLDEALVHEVNVMGTSRPA